MKKIILATLAAGITGFLLGWIIYGMALMDFMTANTTEYEGLMKAEPAIWVYLISNLTGGFLLSWIFSTWPSHTNFMAGFKSAAIIGVLICFAYDIVFWGTMNWINGTALVVDVLAGTFMYGVMGGVAALVLGKVKE